MRRNSAQTAFGMNRALIKQRMLYGVSGAYGLLGAARGVEYYKRTTRERTPLYTDMAVAATIGCFLYVNPILVPWSLYEETVLLEKWLRHIR